MLEPPDVGLQADLGAGRTRMESRQGRVSGAVSSLSVAPHERHDAATRDRLHAARHQLHATVEALTALPEALDSNYRR